MSKKQFIIAQDALDRMIEKEEVIWCVYCGAWNFIDPKYRPVFIVGPTIEPGIGICPDHCIEHRKEIEEILK